MPQYAQMVSFVEEVVRSDSPERTGVGGMELGPAEEEVLGYHRVTQETQPLEVVYEEEEQTRVQWIDNLLDWTVRDHADIPIDYSLGEIANRSFQDRYGIWAGQEEIFPDREVIRPVREEMMVAELSKEIAGKEPKSQIRREVAVSGGLAPWAASAYLRAMAEERCRVDRLSLGEGLVQGTDYGGLDAGSTPWDGTSGRGEGSREVEELGDWEESSGGCVDEFLSSTQISGHGNAPWTGGKGVRTLSPIGGRRGGGLRGSPGPGMRRKQESPGSPGAMGEVDDSDWMVSEDRLGKGNIAMHSPERMHRVIARGAGAAEEPQPGGEAKERQGVDFLSSTLLSGQVGGIRLEEGGDPSLSPLGISEKIGTQGRPSFITGLYQDEDRRLLEITRQGGITFYHSEEGDVEIQERSSGSSIPQRYPPMGESTVDWSLLGRLQYSPEPGRGRKGRGTAEGGRVLLEEPSQGEGDNRPRTSKGTVGGSKGTQEDAGGALQVGMEGRTVTDSEGLLGGLGIRLRKGRYSKKKSGKARRGGRNRWSKVGFLSETDWLEDLIQDGSQPEAVAGPDAEDSEEGLVDVVTVALNEGAQEGRGAEGGAGPTKDGAGKRGESARAWGEEEEEASTRGPARRKEDDEERREDERREEEGSTRRKKKMSSCRRRTQVRTVQEGRLLKNEAGPGNLGRAPDRMSLVWPRRDEIITPGMSDPNRNIVGYRSQEVPVASARTSGVFWSTSRTRDNRRFPGTAEKTLHRQGLESVSAEGTVGGEEEDPLLWPGVRPPEVGPG